MKTIFLIAFFLGTLQAKAINSQSYFKNTFQEAKADFTGRAEVLTKKNGDLYIKNHEIIDSNNPSFAKIDYLFFGKKNYDNLVIIQSGTHGIEGHTGSGVENFLIDYLQDKTIKNTSFLFIHGVNPYGFANNRRTNNNNVDLNRNFATDKKTFQETNPGYDLIQDFLNPAIPAKLGLWEKIKFHISSVLLIAKHSKDTLKRAILKGQYNHNQGVYFGGNEYQPEFFTLNTIWDKFTPAAKKVLLIDIHTGYGERGRLHYLANASNSEDAENLKSIFSKNKIDFGDDKEFYQVSGDITSFFQKKYSSPERKAYALAFEFGTLDSQKTLGSIDSLYRMIKENQGFHHQYQTPEDKKDLEATFLDMFYPKDFTWRDQVLEQSKSAIDQILDYFEKSP